MLLKFIILKTFVDKVFLRTLKFECAKSHRSSSESTGFDCSTSSKISSAKSHTHHEQRDALRTCLAA
jgi:hypothetical protein